jgi:hypothetical protein
MKTLAFILMFTSSAFAADTFEFKGGVTFNHKLHQTERVGKCFVCHENVSVSKDGKTVTTNKPSKIKGFGKEWAHKYCTDCHDLFGEGPVECNDCHNHKVIPSPK